MGYETPNIDRLAKEGMMFTDFAAQAAAAKFAETFKEFPAVQKPNTFTVDNALTKMSEAASGG